MKYCMSKDTPEIYIDGIIYDPDTQTARIDKNKMAEVIPVSYTHLTLPTNREV